MSYLNSIHFKLNRNNPKNKVKIHTDAKKTVPFKVRSPPHYVKKKKYFQYNKTERA